MMHKREVNLSNHKIRVTFELLVDNEPVEEIYSVIGKDFDAGAMIINVVGSQRNIIDDLSHKDVCGIEKELKQIILGELNAS